MAKLEKRTCDECQKPITDGISVRGILREIGADGVVGKRLVGSKIQQVLMVFCFSELTEQDYCRTCFLAITAK